MKKEKINIPEQVKKLAEQRQKARKMKDFKSSDELRDEIAKLGFAINDTLEGYEIKKL